MAGPGRPRKENARRHSLILRLTEEETRIFDGICKDLGMNKSDTVRYLIEQMYKKYFGEE